MYACAYAHMHMQMQAHVLSMCIYAFIMMHVATVKRRDMRGKVDAHGQLGRRGLPRQGIYKRIIAPSYSNIYIYIHIMYLFLGIYIYMYICICIRMYVCAIRICICTCMRMFLFMCMQVTGIELYVMMQVRVS